MHVGLRIGRLAMSAALLGSLLGTSIASTASAAGSATSLAFDGALWATDLAIADFTVSVRDDAGSIVTSGTGSDATIVISKLSGPGTLAGSTTAVASAGVATFAGLTVTAPGSYTLVASSTDQPALTAAQGSLGAIGPPAKLAFGTQPSNVVADAIISPAVTVRVEDSAGQLVSTDTSNVTVSKASGSGSLDGTTTVAAVNGIATFSDLSMDSAGYHVLWADDGSLASATSSAFYVSSGRQLVFVTSPGGGTAGTAWSTRPVVAIEDAAASVLTTDSATYVTLSIGTNPGGGTLSCTSGTTVVAVAGYASFTGCSISVGSTSTYTLVATASPTATSATSSAFYVSSVTPTPTPVTTPVVFTTTTALGRTTSGPFTASTKIQRVGA